MFSKGIHVHPHPEQTNIFFTIGRIKQINVLRGIVILPVIISSKDPDTRLHLENYKDVKQ